jgi:hypothetical protein
MNEKTTLKLARISNNFKFLNGWNFENEELWESLTKHEKNIVSEIIKGQIKVHPPHKRMNFKSIVSIVKPYNDDEAELIAHLKMKSISKKRYGVKKIDNLKKIWNELNDYN